MQRHADAGASATRVLRTSLGHHITVIRDDHVGDKIARHGLYERENVELLLALLARMQAPLVLDIGANVGNHSLAFATRAAVVHAFEPIPRIHALLAANAAANGLDNIHAHNLALSDAAGTATIHMVRHGNVGASSFDRRGGDTEAVTVQRDTGDALLSRLGVRRVDLVKIDVEAHELYVLRGLRETLERDLPLLTLEWNDPLTVARLADSRELAFLRKHYRIHVLGSNFDRGWWQGRPLAFVRRKLVRLFGTRRAVLHAFEPTRLYRNLLLVPRGREALLHGLVDLR